MVKKKKAVHARSRKQVPRPKRDNWTIKRIFLPIGIAALILLVSSQVPYTQSFQSDILGDDDAQEEQQKEADKKQEEQNKESSQNSGRGNANIQQKETETETPDGVKVKTKIEDSGVRKMEIESNAVKFKFEEKNGEIKLRVKNAQGEEIRTRERTREMEELEQELEDEEIEISSDEGELEIEHNAIRARVNFPLSIDPLTKQLIVTTPVGERTVGILPDAAVQRMVANGVLTRVDDSSFAASESGITSGSLEMKVEKGNLIYEATGEKQHKLFGFVPVTTKRKVTISALTGEVLSQNQTVLSSIVDLLSF